MGYLYRGVFPSEPHLQHHTKSMEFYRNPRGDSLLHEPAAARSGVALLEPAANNARYWARVIQGMDFWEADRVDDDTFNRIL